MVEPYDGSINPQNHLEGYKVFMMLQDASDTLLYLTFLTTLNKVVQTWYCGLQLISITSFEQLGRQFIAHFENSRVQSKTSDSLFSLYQGEGESLRDYVV